MPEKIYIIGHKSPDLDSVAAAIMYADYKNKFENTYKYEAAVSGALNKETKYALQKFSFKEPELLADASDKKFILVDHNEKTQSPKGIENAEVVEVLDHHKVDFSYGSPIKFRIEAWGATCSIIADLYFENRVDLSSDGAGLLLSAILVDTVIGKSPTCMAMDIAIMDKLCVLAGVEDWKKYGMELFKVRSDMGDMSEAEILRSDYKDFDVSGKKFGIGQVETADLGEFKEREKKILEEIKKTKVEGAYNGVILFITDIINEGSLFLAELDDNEDFEKIFAEKLEENKAYIPGIISRKKQVAPKITEFFREK